MEFYNTHQRTRIWGVREGNKSVYSSSIKEPFVSGGRLIKFLHHDVLVPARRRQMESHFTLLSSASVWSSRIIIDIQ